MSRHITPDQRNLDKYQLAEPHQHALSRVIRGRLYLGGLDRVDEEVDPHFTLIFQDILQFTTHLLLHPSVLPTFLTIASGSASPPQEVEWALRKVLNRTQWVICLDSTMLLGKNGEHRRANSITEKICIVELVLFLNSRAPERLLAARATEGSFSSTEAEMDYSRLFLILRRALQPYPEVNLLESTPPKAGAVDVIPDAGWELEEGVFGGRMVGAWAYDGPIPASTPITRQLPSDYLVGLADRIDAEHAQQAAQEQAGEEQHSDMGEAGELDLDRLFIDEERVQMRAKGALAKAYDYLILGPIGQTGRKGFYEIVDEWVVEAINCFKAGELNNLTLPPTTDPEALDNTTIMNLDRVRDPAPCEKDHSLVFVNRRNRTVSMM